MRVLSGGRHAERSDCAWAQLLLLLASDPNVRIVPALAQVLRSGGVSKDRRNSRRPLTDGRFGFQRDALLAAFGLSIPLKSVDVETERLRKRPEVRRVLAPLIGEQTSGKRPERALDRRGLRGKRRATGGNTAGFDDEVAEVDAKRKLVEPVERERTVRARQVGVHGDERRVRRAVDPRTGRVRSPAMRVHALSRTHVLEGTPDDVFPFFADAFNLESITPPLLDFSLLTPAPIALGSGTVIQYAMRLHGVPVNWVSTIQNWDPPHGFVDTQIRGPFRFWHHTHRFEALPGARTRMVDEVRYALPFQPLGELALPLVRRDLRMIFDYRARVIAGRLRAARAPAISERAA